MNEPIYAPNIHLFAFLQSEYFTAETSQKTEHPYYLWECCNNILKTHEIKDQFNANNLTSYKNQEPAGERVSLIIPAAVNNRQSLGFSKTLNKGNSNIPLKGFALPLRLKDCYALGFNLRVPETDNSIPTECVDISIFNDLNINQCLSFQNPPEDYLGQTLILTFTLTDTQIKQSQTNSTYLQTLANTCIDHLIKSPTNQPTLDQQGELFGSPIFEYGNPTDPFCHILVWLFNNPKTSEHFNQHYEQILELLLYRHKVLGLYHQQREKLYTTLRRDYEKIEQTIEQTFSTKNPNSLPLPNLTHQLLQMPPQAVEYTRTLRDLETLRHTLSINCRNYEKIAKKITAYMPAHFPHSKDTILQNFSQEIAPNLIEQINSDLGYFQPGAGLLDSSINAIKGIVEIQQTQQERNLQNTIQSIGFGLGAVGIVASTAPYLIPQNPENYPLLPPFSTSQLHPFTVVLLLSLGAGLGVWLLSSILLKWWQKK
jgi:hypothetical protein